MTRVSRGGEDTQTLAHRRQTLRAVPGLLLATFLAALSTTIVGNTLPRIAAELDGSQSQYTWIFTTTLLSATASGPIWGKLADRMSRKILIEAAIATFLISALLAGLAPNIELLIALRVLQGVGVGGLIPLIQIVLASLVSPRERGRYIGYFFAVNAAAAVAGPLLGGLLVDLLNWRWCFWAEIPFSIAALILLHKTLELPMVSTHSKIDVLGALIIPAGVSVFLLWVSLGGRHVAWFSWKSAILVVASVTLVALAVVVERRAADPVIPPRVLRNKTMRCVFVADMALSVMALGAGIFVAQYLQLGRGYSPTESGLLTQPLILGLVVAAILSGQRVTHTGRWKKLVTTGIAIVVVGLCALGTLDSTTPLILVTSYFAVMGLGLGMSTPHLIVIVQNVLDYRELGVGSATLTFLGMLGAAVGTSILGSVVSNSLGSGIPHGEVAQQAAYSSASATAFLVAAGITAISLVAILFVPEDPLRTSP